MRRRSHHLWSPSVLSSSPLLRGCHHLWGPRVPHAEEIPPSLGSSNMPSPILRRSHHLWGPLWPPPTLCSSSLGSSIVEVRIHGRKLRPSWGSSSAELLIHDEKIPPSLGSSNVELLIPRRRSHPCSLPLQIQELLDMVVPRGVPVAALTSFGSIIVFPECVQGRSWGSGKGGTLGWDRNRV